MENGKWKNKFNWRKGNRNKKMQKKINNKTIKKKNNEFNNNKFLKEVC